MPKPSDKAKKEIIEEMNENKRHAAKAELAVEKAKKAREEKKAKKKQELADKVYKQWYRKYTTEENNPRSEYPNADRAIYRFQDRAGDVARKIGATIVPGFNRMTSRDDEAQMKARKDVKGFKKGGSVKAKKGRRGDGICVKGKTKGRMV